MIIPYSLTLDYDGDEKTARVGAEDDPYPYDFWVASSSEPNFSITGDKSSNSVLADGYLVIQPSNAIESNTDASFDITINNDLIYEHDEKIILTLGTTDNSTLTNASLGSFNQLTLTIKNEGEAKSEANFSTIAIIDDENDITNLEGSNPGANSINLPISLSKESGKDIVLKYSIDYSINYPSFGQRFYDSDYPNNENIATKGIDYNFGSTVTKSTDGDSIITISKGKTVVYIPLTIIDDEIDEYDQKIRVMLRVLSSLSDNDAALWEMTLYTHLR